MVRPSPAPRRQILTASTAGDLIRPETLCNILQVLPAPLMHGRHKQALVKKPRTPGPASPGWRANFIGVQPKGMSGDRVQRGHLARKIRDEQGERRARLFLEYGRDRRLCHFLAPSLFRCAGFRQRLGGIGQQAIGIPHPPELRVDRRDRLIVSLLHGFLFRFQRLDL